MYFAKVATACCLAATAFASPIARRDVAQGLQLSGAEGISQDVQSQVAPHVANILSSLGFSGFSPNLGALTEGLNLPILSRATSVLDELDISGLSSDQLTQVAGSLDSLNQLLPLAQHVAGEDVELSGVTPGALENLLTPVEDIFSKFGVGQVIGMAAPEKRQASQISDLGSDVPVELLTSVAPDLTSLLTVLNLQEHLSGVFSLLSVLG